MNAWIAGWKSHIVPIREEAGFRLIGAWVDAQDDRFVWLLGYSGAEGFQAADDRYYASQKRRELQPEPSALVEGQADHGGCGVVTRVASPMLRVSRSSHHPVQGRRIAAV